MSRRRAPPARVCLCAVVRRLLSSASGRRAHDGIAKSRALGILTIRRGHLAALGVPLSIITGSFRERRRRTSRAALENFGSRFRARLRRREAELEFHRAPADDDADDAHGDDDGAGSLPNETGALMDGSNVREIKRRPNKATPAGPLKTSRRLIYRVDDDRGRSFAHSRDSFPPVRQSTSLYYTRRFTRAGGRPGGPLSRRDGRLRNFAREGDSSRFTVRDASAD